MNDDFISHNESADRSCKDERIRVERHNPRGNRRPPKNGRSVIFPLRLVLKNVSTYLFHNLSTHRCSQAAYCKRKHQKRSALAHCTHMAVCRQSFTHMDEDDPRSSGNGPHDLRLIWPMKDDDTHTARTAVQVIMTSWLDAPQLVTDVIITMMKLVSRSNIDVLYKEDWWLRSTTFQANVHHIVTQTPLSRW